MTGASTLRPQLEALLAGRLPRRQLTVTYSDLHGLHGGLELSLRGTGEVTQAAVRTIVYPPRPWVDPGAIDALQISARYPPAPELVARFSVRIIHQGPAGWAWE